MNWRTIAEFPRFEISDTGEVRSIKTGRAKSHHLNTNSLPYRVVSFNGSRNGRKFSARRTVHRLVALAFVPNPLTHPIVRHIDGNCANNAAFNLAWGTWTENQLDATRHGTRNTSKSGRRFGAELRAKIVAMSESGKSDNQIAKELGEYQGSVSRVMRDHRRTIKPIEPALPGSPAIYFLKSLGATFVDMRKPAMDADEETRAAFTFAGREIIKGMNEQNRKAKPAKKARAA